MSQDEPKLVSVEVEDDLWRRVFMVAPLVLVGTREEDGRVDMAPKHMVTTLGWENHFGFVCTPQHRTYHNARREGVFTVSFPRPSQLLMTSLAAAPRCGEDAVKPALDLFRTVPAKTIDGVLLANAYLHLECELARVIDGFGENSLVAGRVVAARASADALRDADRDDADVVAASPLLAYLHPGRYAVIERSFAFPISEDLETGSPDR